MGYSILISIILVLGGAQGPTGDFDQNTTVSDPVATSQTTTTSTDTVKPSKKG